MNLWSALPDRRSPRRFVILALVVAAVAGVFVAVASPSGVAFAASAAGLGLVAILSAISPRFGVVLVFAVSTLSGITLATPVGVLRLDQAVVLPALGGVVARLVSTRDANVLMTRRAPAVLAICLGLYVLLNFASTILVAVDSISSLRVGLWLLLSFAAFVLTVLVAGRWYSVGMLLDDVLAFGTAASAAGVALYGLALLGIGAFGVQTDSSTGQVVAKGLMHEGNLLGSLSGMTAILAASQVVDARGRSGRRRAMLLLSVVISTTAVLLSFTRGAWLGLAVGGLVLMVLSRPQAGRARAFARSGLVLAAAGTILLVSGLGAQVADRLLSLLTDSTGTIAFRSASYELALAGVWDEPIIGHGTNSFGQYFLDATQDYGPGYLGGLFIATIWDVGFAGLSVLLVAFAAVAWKLRQGLAGIDDAARSQVAGFSAAFVCALVAYQATNGFWFAYNWILIGLAASIPVSRLVRRPAQYVQSVVGLVGSQGARVTTASAGRLGAGGSPSGQET